VTPFPIPGDSSRDDSPLSHRNGPGALWAAVGVRVVGVGVKVVGVEESDVRLTPLPCAINRIPEDRLKQPAVTQRLDQPMPSPVMLDDAHAPSIGDAPRM
jgi:hypothetical protein